MHLEDDFECFKKKHLFLQRHMATKLFCEAVKFSSDPHIENTLYYYHALGADVNAYDDNGVVPLFYAKKPSTVTILMALGAKIPVPAIQNRLGYYYKGATAVHYAAVCGNYDVLEILLQHDACCYRDLFWLTVLHYAAFKNNNERVIQLLVEKKIANVNAGDVHGCTPLMVASMIDLANVKCLLSFGADPLQIDKNGNGALDHANASIFNIEVKKEIFDLLDRAIKSQSDQSTHG